MTKETQSQKRKSIFQQAVDAVSNRDEKAAIEAAMKEADALESRAEQAEQKAAQTTQKLAEAERKVTTLQAEVTKLQSELTTTRNTLTGAQNRASEAERKLSNATIELNRFRSAAQVEKTASAAAAAAQAKILAEHKLTADETLSHLALKYYGHATEPYWRIIYEANQELIGSNPSRVRPGMVIKVPVLPEDMKKS